MSSTTGTDGEHPSSPCPANDWSNQTAPDGVITTDRELDLINQLPDGCLVNILCRVGHETLSETRIDLFMPRTRSNYAFQLPVLCALVCRRWAKLVDGWVIHLHLRGQHDEGNSVPASLSQWLARLSALRSLHLKSILSPGARDQYLFPPVSLAEALPLLEELTLSSSYGSKLPASLDGFSRLRSLELNLDDLNSLPYGLSALSSLESLSVSCWRLRVLPASIGSLSALTSLFLGERESDSHRTFHNLHTLPDSLGMLTSLETLTVSQCDFLSRLPETLGSLQRLRVLEISGNRLASIPESIGMLTGLRSLSLKVPFVTQPPAAMWRLSGLHKLVLDCNFDLPEALGDLTALRSLKIDKHLNVSKGKPLRLPDGIGRLTRLQTLIVSTYSLPLLPECLLSLTSLRHVTVYASYRGVRGGHPSLAVLDKLQRQGVSVDGNFRTRAW